LWRAKPSIFLFYLDVDFFVFQILVELFPQAQIKFYCGIVKNLSYLGTWVILLVIDMLGKEFYD